MTSPHDDLTSLASDHLKPIAEALVDAISAELSDDDWSRVSVALTNALRAGVRIGMAHLIASLRDHGVHIDLSAHGLEPDDLDVDLTGDP